MESRQGAARTHQGALMGREGQHQVLGFPRRQLADGVQQVEGAIGVQYREVHLRAQSQGEARGRVQPPLPPPQAPLYYPCRPPSPTPTGPPLPPPQALLSVDKDTDRSSEEMFWMDTFLMLR